MTSCCPRRPTPWNAATAGTARCKRASTACAPARASTAAWPWTCCGKRRPRVGPKRPLPSTPPAPPAGEVCNGAIVSLFQSFLRYQLADTGWKPVPQGSFPRSLLAQGHSASFHSQPFLPLRQTVLERLPSRRSGALVSLHDVLRAKRLKQILPDLVRGGVLRLHCLDKVGKRELRQAGFTFAFASQDQRADDVVSGAKGDALGDEILGQAG